MSLNIPHLITLDGWKYLITKENASTVSIWHHVTPEDGGYGTEVKEYVDDSYFKNHTLLDLYKSICSQQYHSSDNLDSGHELPKLKTCLEDFGLHPTMPPGFSEKIQDDSLVTQAADLPKKEARVKPEQDWDATLLICSKCGTPQRPSAFCKVCKEKLCDNSYKPIDNTTPDLSDSSSVMKSGEKPASQNDDNRLLDSDIHLGFTSISSPNGHGSMTTIFRYNTYTVEYENFFSNGKKSNRVVHKTQVPKTIKTVGELEEFLKNESDKKQVEKANCAERSSGKEYIYSGDIKLPKEPFVKRVLSGFSKLFGLFKKKR